jgi:hypothetical protein
LSWNENDVARALKLKILVSAVSLWVAGGLAMAVAPMVGVAHLAWDPPPKGSPPVKGYLVKWGPKSGSYPNQMYVGKATTAVVKKLLVGHKYYFVVGAYYSNRPSPVFTPELVYTVPR